MVPEFAGGRYGNQWPGELRKVTEGLGIFKTFGPIKMMNGVQEIVDQIVKVGLWHLLRNSW